MKYIKMSYEMSFTCKSNKPTSFDFFMLGLRFWQVKNYSLLVCPSLTAKFFKIRLYTMKGSDTMLQWNNIKKPFGKKYPSSLLCFNLLHMLTCRQKSSYSVIWNKETQFILFFNKLLEFEVKNVYSLGSVCFHSHLNMIISKEIIRSEP
jgi:hypothetical protein